MSVEPIKKTETKPAIKTLKTLTEDPLTIKLDRILVHQALNVPGGNTETTISGHRTGGMKIYLHPVYGYIAENKGRYCIIPAANVIVGYEQPLKSDNYIK